MKTLKKGKGSQKKKKIIILAAVKLGFARSWALFCVLYTQYLILTTIYKVHNFIIPNLQGKNHKEAEERATLPHPWLYAVLCGDTFTKDRPCELWFPLRAKNCFLQNKGYPTITGFHKKVCSGQLSVAYHGE